MANLIGIVSRKDFEEAITAARNYDEDGYPHLTEADRSPVIVEGPYGTGKSGDWREATPGFVDLCRFPDLD